MQNDGFCRFFVANFMKYLSRTFFVCAYYCFKLLYDGVVNIRQILYLGKAVFMLYSDKMKFSTTPKNSDSCEVISPIYRLEKEQRNPLATEKKEIPKAIYSLEEGHCEKVIYKLEQEKKNFLKENSNQLVLLGGNNNLPQIDVKLLQKVEAPILQPNGNDPNFANYSVHPIQKTVYINRNGQEVKERERFICQVQIQDCEPEYLEVLTKDIKRLASIIGDKFSNALLNLDTPHAAKLVENTFRDATKGVPNSYILIDYGWQQINGKWMYVHDDMQISDNIKIQTGMRLPFDKIEKKQAANIFFDACDLYKDSRPMSVILPFSMLGVLYRLFKEAGHAPHFLLFVNGKTGSMKTTLSKILFTQLSDDKHRDTPRRIDSDTITSFERGIIESGRDTVTLIDDFSPAKTPKQQADNEAKLESIIRMVGDGSTKSRSNTNLEDCRGEGVQGIVAITGELLGKGLSSNLRCFYCGICRGDVNEDVVSYFQDNPYRFTTLINHFASYVAVNWEQIVAFIKNSFQAERKTVGQFLKERRLIDSAVVLRLTSKILREFLTYSGKNETDVNALISQMQQDIITMAKNSEEIATEQTLAVRFMKFTDQLLLHKKLNIINKRPNETDLTYIDGFCDKEYYYFLPENLYAKVKQMFCLTNIYQPMNMDEIIKALYEEGIITPSSNGKDKKTYYARVLNGDNKKRSFIKIKKETLKLIANEGGLYE